VPQRTCIACRQVGDKRQLIRVVRTPAMGVRIDPSGKLSGRGAYLCQAGPCWHKALRSGALARALRTTISEEDLAALQAFAASLPSSQEDAPEPLARPEQDSSD
jgi:hypothetical protein